MAYFSFYLTLFRNNPLIGLPKSQLLDDVHRFAAEYDLTDHIEVLQKGALVAQRPHELDDISELSEEDRETLRQEVTHRWRHPRALYFTIAMNSIGSAVQGWDKTGMIASLKPLKRKLMTSVRL